MKVLAKLLVLTCMWVLNTAAMPCPLPHQTNPGYDDTMELSTMADLEHPDYHIPTHIGEEGLETLYQQFEQHFGDYLSENPRCQLTYQFIMGKRSSFETFKLLELYQTAMEEGLPLKRFDKFGLIQRGNGKFKYDYDYDAAPHLANTDMFFSLTSFPKGFMEHYLLPKGFRHSDIKIIRGYVHNNDMIPQGKQLLFDFYTTNFDQIKQMVKQRHVLSTQTVTAQAMQLSYTRSYMLHMLQRNWAITLLQQLDKQRRRILLQVLITKISGTRAGTNKPNTLVDHYIKLIESGSLEQQLKDAQVPSLVIIKQGE